MCSFVTWVKWPLPSAISMALIVKKLYDQLLRVAKRKTAEADSQYDRHGKKVDPTEEEYGKNVLIVDQDPEDLLTEHLNPDNPQQELF